MNPKGPPQAPKRDPRDPQRIPKGPQRTPTGSKNGPLGRQVTLESERWPPRPTLTKIQIPKKKGSPQTNSGLAYFFRAAALKIISARRSARSAPPPHRVRRARHAARSPWLLYPSIISPLALRIPPGRPKICWPPPFGLQNRIQNFT